MRKLLMSFTVLLMLLGTVIGSEAGQRLVIGMGDIPPTLDGHVGAGTGLAASAMHALYDGLTALDAKGILHPALANSWKLLDETTWEFILRDGVKFSNGEPFNAQVVKANLERVLDPQTKAAAVYQRVVAVKRVEAVDERRVRLYTKSPDPILDRKLAEVFMMAPSGFQGGTLKPIGTSPFRVKDYVKGDRLSLEAVKTSWRGVPALQEVIIRVMPESATRMAALRTGEIDMVHNLPPDQAAPLRAAGYETPHAIMGRTHVVLLDTRVPQLRDKRVRQALNHAVDREALVEKLLLKYGRAADGQEASPTSVGYNPRVRPYAYDPERAKKLLAEAGYPEGFSITMDVTQGIYVADKETAEAIAGFLGKIGVKVNLQILEFATFRKKNYEGTHVPMYLIGLNHFPEMDMEVTLYRYASPTESRASWKTYNNPKFDEKFRTVPTLMDRKRRTEVLQEIGELLHDDPPGIFLFHPPDLFAVSSKVKGFHPRPDGVIWFDSIQKLE